MARCYAHSRGCDGPLEKHHVIKQQRIRKAWLTLASEYARGSGPKPWPLKKALEDPRNIVIACKRTHHVEESAVPVPDGFWDYVREYELEPCLPRWLAQEATT